MKTAKLFLFPLRRAKSRRDSTLLTVCFSLRAFSLRAILLPALMFFSCANLHAQVLIGGTDRPKNGAILDLNSTAKGGLLLSNVTLLNLYTIPVGFPGITAPVSDEVKKKFTGAMVYHKGGNDIPTGIYVWNGTNWTSMEENCKSPVLTLTVPFFIKQDASANFSVSSDASPRCAEGETYEWFKSAVNTTNYEPDSFGSGASATTSFASTGNYWVKVVATSPYSAPIEEERSVAVTADGGPDPEKLSHIYGIVGETCLDVKKTDQGKSEDVFNARTNAFENGTAKTYKFVHGGAYSELSLSLDDPSQIVAGITSPPADASGDTPEPFTVTFKQGVRDSVPDNGDSLTVRLYASYKDNNNDTRYAYLEIRVEDGTCICPAKISDTQWLNFMCHNLGALDIISPSQLITYEHHGNWYRFGAKNYSLKNEGTNNLAPGGWSYAANAIPPYLMNNTDWPDDYDNDIGNPCPAGWKLPTNTDWENVATYNLPTNVPTTSWTTGETVFRNLKKLGDGLILPIAGYRYASDGALKDRGNAGLYWSSERNGNITSSAKYSSFTFGNPTRTTIDRGQALSVRCVEE
jgi:uncharacterized protein (TIGR02145 family)